MNFTASHFEKVPADFGLFKFAARTDIILASSSYDKIAKSKKYQVLCDETAFVGVVKQKDKANGQMVEFAVEFGKSVAAMLEPIEQKEEFNNVFSMPLSLQLNCFANAPR